MSLFNLCECHQIKTQCALNSAVRPPYWVEIYFNHILLSMHNSSTSQLIIYQFANLNTVHSCFYYFFSVLTSHCKLLTNIISSTNYWTVQIHYHRFLLFWGHTCLLNWNKIKTEIIVSTNKKYTQQKHALQIQIKLNNPLK